MFFPKEDQNKPHDPNNDKVDKPEPLLPLGAGKKPIQALEPILAVLPKPVDPNKKPVNDKYASERVALFAKEQIKCNEPYRSIEAKKITDNTYRINFLADDTDVPKLGCGHSKLIALFATTKRVHSTMVRVVWGKQIILTEMLPPPRN